VPSETRFAVTCLGYSLSLRLTEWHDEEVSPVLGTEDSLPEKDQWVESRDVEQTSLEQVERRGEEKAEKSSFPDRQCS